jgi:hypothetical protein
MTSVTTGIDPVRQLNDKAKRLGWTFLCDRALHFDAPQLGEIRALWESRCSPGKIPARRAFSARDLLRVLPVLMIVELVPFEGRMRFRYRYVGTYIASTIGETTGLFLDEVLAEPASSGRRPATRRPPRRARRCGSSRIFR